MKQTLTNFLIIATIGLMCGGMISCRKDSDYIDIKTYDQQQIQAYLQSNNLTGYTRDLSGGDTSGIYYKITNTGTGTALDYSDQVFFVYTVRTLDGAFIASDTIINRAYNYVGRLAPAYTSSAAGLQYLLPTGLQLAFKNILKYRGAQGHVILPSHLAFGKSEIRLGSNRISGNQSLDYYINIVDPAKQAAYDDGIIQKYMAANALTGFTKTNSGLYYKITAPGTGTAKVTANSTLGTQYLLKLMNNTVVQDATNTDTTVVTSLPYANVIKGVQEGFQLITPGARISLIIPSSLAYGVTGTSGIVPNSCIYYDFFIRSITN